jgi:hypothetical protein
MNSSGPMSEFAGPSNKAVQQLFVCNSREGMVMHRDGTTALWLMGKDGPVIHFDYAKPEPPPAPPRNGW